MSNYHISFMEKSDIQQSAKVLVLQRVVNARKFHTHKLFQIVKIVKIRVPYFIFIRRKLGYHVVINCQCTRVEFIIAEGVTLRFPDPQKDIITNRPDNLFRFTK